MSTHLKMPWQESGRQIVNAAGLQMGWALLNFLCCVDCFYFIQYFPLKYQFIIDDSDVSDVYLLALDWTCKQIKQIGKFWVWKRTGWWAPCCSAEKHQWLLRNKGYNLVVFHRFQRTNLAYSFLCYFGRLRAFQDQSIKWTGVIAFPLEVVLNWRQIFKNISGQMRSWADRFRVESFCFARLDSTIWKSKPAKPLTSPC